MFEGESRTHDYLEKLFEENGPIVALGKIKNRFCSVLTEPDSYRKLVSSLGLDDAVMSLLRLGDAVAIESFHGDDSRRELIRSKAFHLSALRQGNAYFAWRRGRRFLRRNPLEPIADAASNFSVQVQLPGFTNAHEVNFNFQRDELIRNRIAVLIGRNGVGKTQLFLSMIKALVPSAPLDLTGQILAEAKFDPVPSFNSLLVFSSTFADPYPQRIHPWEGGIDYQYFSIIGRAPHQYSVDADELTGGLIDIVRSDDLFDPQEGGNYSKKRRIDILWMALESYLDLESVFLPIASGTPPAVWKTSRPDGTYVALQWLNGEQRRLEITHSLDWTRPPIILKDGNQHRLSSGQLAMFRFAVQAIGAVSTGSLLLLDEPETHLHPNFISVFVNILHEILAATGSCAIIATHSAYIVREVPRSRVRVISVEDDSVEVSQPRLQTFGASVDSISQFVFGDTEVKHLHQILLKNWLGNEASIEDVLSKYGEELNPERLLYIRRIMDEGQD